MHLSVQFLVSAVLAVSSAVMAAPTENPQRLMVFPCPELYGTCNSCTFLPDGTLASVTRKVCEPYTEEQCVKLYGDKNFLCDDNCNSCFCTKGGLASTRMACPAYNFKHCVSSRGSEPWDCGNRKCVCNKYGIASYF
ncbi:hypothetical protein BGW42_008122 [Actinomortierella wolfii]|nr:hypothetical protein BGW42_008122 [Actinomortierella wolfii]KAG0236172.1 hypothetical protein BGW41_000533 [Actinomortierella wolfii]